MTDDRGFYLQFMIGFMCTSPIFANAIKRIRPTYVMTFGLTIFAMADVLCATSHSYLLLLCARALVGVGEARYLLFVSCQSCDSFCSIAPTLIDDCAPKQKHGIYLSVYFAANPGMWRLFMCTLVSSWYSSWLYRSRRIRGNGA